LMGTYTHVNWVVRHGFLYPDVPVYSRIFWDSLTFLDPLAALLLFLRPRKGVLLVCGSQRYASSSVLISSFTIFIIACMTRPALALSLSSSSVSLFGTTCQDKPNLSFNQPH
jgi:hypothetical protein